MMKKIFLALTVLLFAVPFISADVLSEPVFTPDEIFASTVAESIGGIAVVICLAVGIIILLEIRKGGCFECRKVKR
jgi:hypothetical protein